MSRQLGLPVIGKTPFLENIEAFILKRIAAAQREHHSSSERAGCAAATAQTYGELAVACGPMGALGALPTSSAPIWTRLKCINSEKTRQRTKFKSTEANYLI